MVASVSSSRRIAPTARRAAGPRPSSIESSSACRCSAKIAAQQTSTTGTGNHTRLRVTAARLPMIQYSDAGQLLLGVGGQLEQHQQRLGQRVDGDARQHQRHFAAPRRGNGQPQREEHRRSPPAKAQTVVDSAPDETNRMANAAPTLAPEETPMMSGLPAGCGIRSGRQSQPPPVQAADQRHDGRGQPQHGEGAHRHGIATSSAAGVMG